MSYHTRGRVMKRVLPVLLVSIYFNALFTFENVASTPAVRLVPELSIELVLLLAGLAGIAALGWKLSGIAKASLAAVLFVLTLVRYVDVTALGVLGREFNLYGDAPHLTRVFEMFWEAVSLSAGILIVGTLCLVSGLVVGLNGLGIAVLEKAMRERALRKAVIFGSPVLLSLFVLGGGRGFAVPSASIAVKQIRYLREGQAEKRAGATIHWPPQNLDSNLEGLGGANVFLIFLESYGVTVLDDSQHWDAIAPRYRELEEHLCSAGYHFASSRIDSPTFGGGSWRAHATLLSGFHVDTEHLYNALIDSDRMTLPKILKKHGYRTVAAEPGIKWFWPEGKFYGFDEIYAFDDLGYDGPPMGWWKIPDQFTLYRIYKEEIRNATKPVFAKFSLIMTHIPYFPVPDYVEDWTQFDDGTAYQAPLHSVAHDAYRDLRELSTWYVAAFRYEWDVLEGFLLRYVPENALVIVVGDHQPPKLATHDNDSWAVPMHVLSKREDLVRAFDPLGFEPGLVPRASTSLTMADFLPKFLEIFDRP